MGHANLTNISAFFLRRLYARGTLTIKECVQAMMEKGVKLQASEGEYDDEAMLSHGCEQVVGHFIDGGYVVADFPVFDDLKLSMQTINILDECLEQANDQAIHNIAADALLDEGHSEWADHIRSLPAQRLVFVRWINDEDLALDDYQLLDRIHWLLAPGHRRQYKNIPLLGNVTN